MARPWQEMKAGGDSDDDAPAVSREEMLVHDLSNHCLSVMLNLDLAVQALRRDGVSLDELGVVVGDAHRAASTMCERIEDARSFLDRGRAAEVVDVVAEIRRACRLVDPLLPMRTTLEVELCSFPPVIGYATDMLHAVTNLLHNAIQSVKQVPGRAHRIGVSLCARSDGAVLIVEDSGTGIPAQAMDRIFDPYFTTKPRGEGSGLGLAIVREVIERHGGSVTASNGSDGGACFTVTLPDTTPIVAGAPYTT